jgi:hypothetical protein
VLIGVAIEADDHSASEEATTGFNGLATEPLPLIQLVRTPEACHERARELHTDAKSDAGPVAHVQDIGQVPHSVLAVRGKLRATSGRKTEQQTD